MEQEQKKKQLALGLDLGVASCGWSLLDITDPNNMKLLDLGVRLFDEASNGGAITKAGQRRGKRSLRRRLRRLRFKKHNLLHLFAKYNLVDGQNFDEKVDNAKKVIENIDANINPLDLKLKGLKEKLTKKELVIALYSYMSHRGFFYDVQEDENKEKESEKKEETEVKKFLQNHFPSEWENNNRIKFGKYIGLKNNSQISHKDWVREIEELFRHQDSQIVSNDFKNAYLSWFNYIRPFNVGPGNEHSPTPYGLYRRRYDKTTNEVIVKKIGENLWDETIGRCSIYPNENRELRFAPITELCNLINHINDIRPIIAGKKVKLSVDQKKIIYSEIDKLLLTKDALKNKSLGELISFATLWKILEKACKGLEFQKDSFVGISEEKPKVEKGNEAWYSLKYFYAIASFLHDCNLIKDDDMCIIKDDKFNVNLVNQTQEVFRILSKTPYEKDKQIENLKKYLTNFNIDSKDTLIEKLCSFLNNFNK